MTRLVSNLLGSRANVTSLLRDVFQARLKAALSSVHTEAKPTKPLKAGNDKLSRDIVVELGRLGCEEKTGLQLE